MSTQTYWAQLELAQRQQANSTLLVRLTVPKFGIFSKTLGLYKTVDHIVYGPPLKLHSNVANGFLMQCQESNKQRQYKKLSVRHMQLHAKEEDELQINSFSFGLLRFTSQSIKVRKMENFKVPTWLYGQTVPLIT